MPQTNEGILLFVGAVFFLIGILGGGFEISAIKIPSVGKYVRIISGGIGVIFMGLAIRQYIFPPVPGQSNTAPLTASTPTIITVALPPATIEPGEISSTPDRSSASPSPISPGTILLQEYFEDDKPLPFSFIENGNWKQSADETGNQVYEIDNRTGSGYPQLRFGTPYWKNYAIEFRTRILDFALPDSMVFCPFRRQGDQYYALEIKPQEILLEMKPHPQLQGTELGAKSTALGKGIWYSIRVEAQEMQLRVFLDNDLIIDTTDSRVSQGDIALGAAPGTYVQFDDIRVIALGE